MTRLSGQSAPLDLACPGKDEPGSPFVAARRLSAGNAGRLRVNLRRSLQLHRRLALGMALAGAVLAAAWFVKLWPVYIAQSQVYIQPAPPRVMEQGGALRWPYDTGTYESYLQQQVASVTRPDVLANALHTLGPGPWQGSGESDQAATERLRKAIEATRVGGTYQLSISARASNPEIAAQMANAVTASYIESAARELKAGNAERMALLREELARVKADLALARSEHEGQSEQPSLVAGGTASKLQPGELAADIARLQARFAAVDGQLHNLMLEDRAPGAAFLTTAAVAPLHPAVPDAARNVVLLAFAAMLLGILAAVAAHKLDPRVYIAADVEQVLGMAPMAQLADFVEVSDGVAEEQLLRLSAAIEYARKQGMKSCIFTGAGAGAGVTTVATRVRDTLEAMGRATVLVDAAGTPAARAHDSAEEAPATQRGSRPTSLLRQVAEETKEERLVLTDTAPLTVSAETETLARYVDCVVIVIESGVTTRTQLREVASILRRLDVAAVGFVLNCVGLETADPAFRRSVQATEQHLRSRRTARQTVRSRSQAAEKAPDAKSYSNESNARTQPETVPDVAAERSASFFMAETATAAPRPQSEATTPRERESMRPLAEPDSGAPWWLADLFTQPDASRSAVVPAKARDGVSQPVAVPPASERHAPPAQSWESASMSFDDLRPEAAQAEVRQPAPEATSYNPPSRLSSLKNLFSSTRLNYLNEAREAVRTAADKTFVPLPEPAPIAGTSQRQVFARPEFLPPKPVVQAGKERGRQTGSTDHRDRREAYDEMEILPPWRGQYRTKN
jgi:Mrp family chromosome partitioning ATPase